ncbi:MAG TPA: prolyl oligopeptidase family serine peptidase [Streptosporangiaceae bacterium]|jgi:oligopeptidase B
MAAPGDPFAWMRDAQQPAMLAHLAGERAHYDRQTASLAGLRGELLGELTSRTPAAERSVSWRRGGHSYFTQTLAGKEYEQFCRAAADGADGRPGQVLLDENALATEPGCTGGYVALGVREVSPDGRLLAYSVDFDGDEVYQLRVRDLASGVDLPDRIERSYYSLAWSADSGSLFYTVTDDKYRPHQVRRHVLGTPAADDTVVHAEDDERFDLTVRATRSAEWILIETESRDTTETLLIPAHRPAEPPRVLEPRRTGVEYRADHGHGPDGGEFYLVTNDGAEEFRLVKAPAEAPGRARWSEVIAGSPDTRVVACDVFGDYLAVEQRHRAATQLLIIGRQTGTHRLIEAGAPHLSLALAVNEEYRTPTVTVRTESLIDPPAWHDVALSSGEWRLRQRKDVPGYDPSQYRTQRLAATAADGTAIPVTIAYRAAGAGGQRDGTSPCLLYGYGAYESCEWPEFAPATVSLLDRGFVYAVAHIRGGGEGGRRWWLQGRLNHKRNTFTDFIAAADMLAEQGWAAGDRIVSRGLSAGGLLQGAVFSMTPRRWRAVVAEVPFVDCVTTMLDPDIPLTVTEWDEWGDPRDPAARAYLASYSPYDNIPARPWPDLLVTGSLHDPRVLIHEPAKWVAKLRAAAGPGAAMGSGDGTGRVLFRPELGAAAHTGPAGRYDRLRYEAEILAFITDAATVRE